MYKQPKISIVIPYHDMENAEFFLKRNIDSIMSQTFKDYEIVLTKDGKMAENTNSGIKRARGELIKILYLDDYLAHPNVLKHIITRFDIFKEAEWGISSASDNIYPEWTDDIETGNNTLGSPSALIFRNHFEENLLFDERLSWLLDCDYYKRLQSKYGVYPTLLGSAKGLLPENEAEIQIIIGKGEHQMTHILTDEQKLAEHDYMRKKYE